MLPLSIALPVSAPHPSPGSGDLWVYGSALVVFIGVAGETVADLTAWIKSEKWRKVLAKASALVLMLGLAGDVIAIHVTRTATALLNKEAAESRQAAGLANERAEEAEARAAHANAEVKRMDEGLTAERARVAGLQIAAAKAVTTQREVERDLALQQEKAARAERSLLQLRASLRPRTISAQQRRELIKLLSSGPKGPVTILWVGSDPDSWPLAVQIEGILNASGWPHPQDHFLVGGTGVGFWLGVRDMKKAPSYGVSLQRAFDSVGIILEGFSRPSLAPGSVVIYIGHKSVY